jgi:hypothetical protein
MSRTARAATNHNRTRKAADGARRISGPLLRLRLAAMGASPVAPTQGAKPAVEKRRQIPRVSTGQLIRAAIVALAACLIVAFPPPGLEKRDVATSVVDAGSTKVER